MDFDAAMISVAPAYRLDGQGGVFVRSRTSREGVYFVTEHDGDLTSCSCPGFTHRAVCWHLGAAEKAQAWEDAARLLRKHRSTEQVLRTWEAIVTDCTDKRGKVRMLEAMETFCVAVHGVFG